MPPTAERRASPRWKAASHKHAVVLRNGKGGEVAGMVVDVSARGMGIRADRGAFAPGMRLGLTVDLLGETYRLDGEVRFVDRFFPRIGLRIESVEAMGRLVRRAETGDFLMAQAVGGTLVLHGCLTLMAMRELGATDCRQLDLSRVRNASIAGAGIVSMAAGRGVRIACCSEPIAPLFEALGICRAGICVSAEPCDLPKAWPTGRTPAE